MTSMTSLQELIDQKATIEREINKVRAESRANAIARIVADMEENGLTIDDLVKSMNKSVKPASTARHPVAAKYRDAVSGAAWSGRGLKPRWLVAALEAGKSLSDFAV
jgi:DNA-binding protein H-NS